MAVKPETAVAKSNGNLPARVTENPAVRSGKRARVLIIGGGFAGLHAATGLAKQPVDVTLIDRRNHHTFQPLLYQVALAVLSPANIAQPIRSIFRNQPNIEVLMDEAVGFHLDDRRVQMKSGALMEYDYLMVATGSTHSYFGKDEWAKFAPGLKTVEDATEIRRRVLLAFELAERQMLETGSHPPLNFVIIGGGPTGVELAGAISDIARLYMKRDFRHIDPSMARVMILEGGPRILPSYPDDLSQKAVDQLHGLGVEVRTSARVTDVQAGHVMLGDERIDAIVTIWAAGVQASPLGKLLGVETDKRGCVPVDLHLNPAGYPEVFVCGDLAHVVENGRQIPGVAQPAMQMGDHVARMIGQDIDGKPRTDFHYFDKGDMSTIGRMAAVAKVEWPFKAHWGGFLAWATWLVVHIFFLIGFRNRVAVLFEWAYTYFTFTRGARLITGDLTLPGWNEQEGVHPAPTTRQLDETAPGVSGNREDHSVEEGAVAAKG
jgi:NADH dehydrogenase